MYDISRSNIAGRVAHVHGTIGIIVAASAGPLGPILILMGVWLILQVQGLPAGNDLICAIAVLMLGALCIVIAMHCITTLPESYRRVLCIIAFALGLLSGPFSLGFSLITRYQFPPIKYPLTFLPPLSVIASIVVFSRFVRTRCAKTAIDKIFTDIGSAAPIAWCIFAGAHVMYVITHV